LVNLSDPILPGWNVRQSVSGDGRELGIDIDVPAPLTDDGDAVGIVLEHGEERLFLLDELFFRGLALGDITDVPEDEIPFGQGKPRDEYLGVKFVAVFRAPAPALEELIFPCYRLLPQGRLVYLAIEDRVIRDDGKAYGLFPGESVH